MLRPAPEPCACGRPKSQVAKTCWECRKNRVARPCAICGTEFTAKRSTERETCSPRCAAVLRGRRSGAKQRRKVALVCQHCGQRKLVSPAYAGRRYCSTDCWYQANSGPRNPKWRGGISGERDLFDSSPRWRAARKAVWRRDDATCRRCGTRYTHDQPTFEVHHLRPFEVRDARLDLDNLVLLCLGCHRWVHSRRNTLREFVHPTD
jgi:5-methylcytosine-specific restriction endonuclease McrA